ncbi:MAG: exodeoxyribonuclease VII large subunit, partial [Desulfobulbus sp.]
MNEPKIFSVTELTTTIKNVLEQRYSFIRVAGEVTNLRKPGSGHCYFTLKDNHAQIKTVLFKTQQRYLEKQPQNGQMIICQGRISVYEPRGDYQLIVDTIDFHGAGALQLAFEQLKVKLDGEGLFDRESKKKLLLFPRHITLVTSPTGAAVHDFITIALKRLPQIRL